MKINKIINSQTIVNTDPLKVFDSFSEFVKPISNPKKLPENLTFGFSVVHNTKVSKIVERQLTLISDGERCNCCRSPLFVAFKTPDINFSLLVLFIESTFHS